ncbi:hypothetical protein [Chryseobacterium herbae]|uniref:DUF3592 domain-containing protein n=1 Tax=Chryseobacterium herbae TaxID=2976476 RepID=A0ABT2IY41_9FLAO|nr:hypothetical protein [Chryseobacterium sp. pc1-10]MCT2563761.1 hypothetical protein [Chryseobacterium sp. pc1-10]
MEGIKGILKAIKNNYHIILGLATLIIIITTLFLSRHDLKNAKKNSKYTIAYITSNWHQKNNNGVGTDFTYEVNGEKIEKTCANNLEKGTRYIVLYDSIAPKNYIMLYNHPLPDSIKRPLNGWKFNEVPVKLDSSDLKQYFQVLKLD